MIKYSLTCKNCNLSFDSWFSSSKEFEKLKKKKLLNCHRCNSIKIEKNLMAPNLVNKKLDKNNDKELKKYNKVKKIMYEYQKFIKNNLKYVGDNFAFEARSIHYNKKKKGKGIYGSASKKDLKELHEEGIDTQMIPWIKENNS